MDEEERPWVREGDITLLHTEDQVPVFLPVLRIRIHRIHMFLGLLDPDPDPLVRGMYPDPSIIKPI